MANQQEALRELALFAGAGGGILGGHLLGWRCVCAVEWEPYPAGVLIARQNEGILPPFPIWDDVRTFDGRPWRGIVDVVSGGFPCQDISAAGKGAGIEGERSGMWKEMARIIGEVRPRFAFVENSPMLTSRGLGVVLGDLAALGYDAEWGVLGADDAGAPHRRERIWILAHTDAGHNQSGQQESDVRPECAESVGTIPVDVRTDLPYSQHPIGQLADPDMRGRLHGQAEERTAIGGVNAQREPEPSGEDVAIPNCARLEGAGEGREADHIKREGTELWGAASERGGWWTTEPGLGRVAHGVADRVDRLKAIGNGQVPQVAVLAWNALYSRIKR